MARERALRREEEEMMKRTKGPFASQINIRDSGWVVKVNGMARARTSETARDH